MSRFGLFSSILLFLAVPLRDWPLTFGNVWNGRNFAANVGRSVGSNNI